MWLLSINSRMSSASSAVTPSGTSSHTSKVAGLRRLGLAQITRIDMVLFSKDFAATLRQRQCRIYRGQKKPRSRRGLVGGGATPQTHKRGNSHPTAEPAPRGASVRPTGVVLTGTLRKPVPPVDGGRAAPRFNRAGHKSPRSVVRLRHFVFAPHHATPRHFFRLVSAASRPV